MILWLLNMHRCCAVAPGWMACGLSILREDSFGFSRDYLLPLPTPDLEGCRRVPADYIDVVTEKERMVWRDAAYAERFREQDLAEEEAQQVALMESHGMGEAPLSSDDMEDVEEDDDSDDEDDPQPEEERPARPSSRGSEPPQSALV